MWKVFYDRWDVLSGDLVLVEGVDGHSDIAYGVYDPKFYRRFALFFYTYMVFHERLSMPTFVLKIALFVRWCLKKDFLFLRRWRHDQDGSFCKFDWLVLFLWVKHIACDIW